MIFVIALVVFILYYACRAAYSIFLSHQLSSQALAFESHPKNPTLKILILGDSTGVGTGSSHNRDTIAGLLAKDFTYADITNRSKNGMRSAQLLKFITTFPVVKSDYIFIHSGGGDIASFEKPEVIVHSIETILIEAKKRAKKVIYLPPGDVGRAPFIPWFLRRYYTNRTVYILNQLQKLAKTQGVVYVDMLHDKNGQSIEIKKEYYARDGMHVSSKGNGIWYKEIKKHINSGL